MSGADGRLAILGGGAWGTALACVARRTGRPVRLWGRNAEAAAAINAGRGNPDYLPDIDLPKGIEATTDLAHALDGAAAALIVVPAQAVRDAAGAMAPHVPDGLPVALCAKGVERESFKLMTEVAAEALPQARLAVLSGPTFAAEVARGLPTAVTLAAADRAAAQILRAALASERFRPYLSDDPVGAEVAGAAKNVIAIACGVAWGLGLGENARAALLTRGLAEIGRIARALGGDPRTMAGLAGLGDLTLTAGSRTSRNTSFGYELGRGAQAQAVLGGRRGVTEGFWTAQAIVGLAERAGVEDLPIIRAVADVLAGRITTGEAMQDLLSRPVGEEGL
ncbi:MAG: NAD(P)-dependent glycerol-3-phosphate dehydrogenase [Alphaproteobacteria bacterium]|nr:NAD(P)-dependent glycerol-3-phosphate dehydrogenase [Alphaproteobacteria bacterium]